MTGVLGGEPLYVFNASVPFETRSGEVPAENHRGHVESFCFKGGGGGGGVGGGGGGGGGGGEGEGRGVGVGGASGPSRLEPFKKRLRALYEKKKNIAELSFLPKKSCGPGKPASDKLTTINDIVTPRNKGEGRFQTGVQKKNLRGF